MIADLFAVIAPVLFTAGLGYYWGRSGRPFDTAFITPLVSTFGTPCLIFSILSRVEIDPDRLGEMAGATLIVIATTAATAGLFLKLARFPIGPFLGPLTFANTGNMGLPLALFAFGKDGLAYAITHFTTITICNFTIGQMIAAGPGRIMEVLKTPILPAALLGAIVAGFHLTVPQWIINTTQLVGSLTIPLMLLALGVSLSRMAIRGVGRTLAMAVFRLSAGFLIGWGVGKLLGLPDLAAKVLILQSTMPVAVYNYLFALRYDRRPDEVASLVVMSTVLAFGVLPVLLWYLLPG